MRSNFKLSKRDSTVLDNALWGAAASGVYEAARYYRPAVKEALAKRRVIKNSTMLYKGKATGALRKEYVTSKVVGKTIIRKLGPKVIRGASRGIGRIIVKSLLGAAVVGTISVAAHMRKGKSVKSYTRGRSKQ